MLSLNPCDIGINHDSHDIDVMFSYPCPGVMVTLRMGLPPITDCGKNERHDLHEVMRNVVIHCPGIVT